MAAPRIEVRDARSDDAEALARLCTQLGYPVNAADMPARLERLHADSHARAFVAVNVGKVVGLATVHLRDVVNHSAPIAQLTLLVVDEQARANGIGRALVGRAESWAQECGARRMTVTTALDRAGAHAFYERVGYSHTGRRYARNLPPPS